MKVWAIKTGKMEDKKGVEHSTFFGEYSRRESLFRALLLPTKKEAGHVLKSLYSSLDWKVVPIEIKELPIKKGAKSGRKNTTRF